MKNGNSRKWIIIAAAIAAAALACAFFLGGRSGSAAAPSAPPIPSPTITAASQTASVPAVTEGPTAESAQPAAAPAVSAPAETAHACTISISCAVLLDHMDGLDAEKRELVPADGIILAPVSAVFTPGENVFDVLQRVCREKGIQMEFTSTPAYGSAYIEGIANIYEFDAGDTSGWVYSVNGAFPGYGSSKYTLSDGDVIRWIYTLDLGKDAGGG